MVGIKGMEDSQGNPVCEGFYRLGFGKGLLGFGHVSKDSEGSLIYEDVGGYLADLDFARGNAVQRSLTPISDSEALEMLNKFQRRLSEAKDVVGFINARLPNPNFDAFEDERVTGAIEHQLKQM